MGFIELVRERTKHSQDYEQFMRLWPSYKMVDLVGVVRPKVYITIPKAELADIKWSALQPRVPNLFTMRPTIFINSKQDFLLRDESPKGFTNFTISSHQWPKDALKSQAEFLAPMPNDTAVLLEEFPLTYSNVIHYPIHYRVHTFGNVIGCIQGTTNQDLFWMDTECKILASAHNKDVSNLVPSIGVMEDICAAAKAISMATKLPYIRIDFVASTRGAMFRSFACIPGDVRSDDHNWFYKQNDRELGQLWAQAAHPTTTQHKDDVDANRQKSRTRPTEAPDDNA